MPKSSKKPSPHGNRRPRLEWVEAGSLTPNPRNWRIHPKRQLEALAARLKAVGFTRPVVWNERTKRLIDGHGRLKLCQPRDVIPVFVVDLSEEEETRELVSGDLITGMADVDLEALKALDEDLDLVGPLAPIGDLVEEMLSPPGNRPSTAAAPGEGGDNSDGGGRQAKLESSYQVVALCRDEAHQAEVFALLKDHKIACRVLTMGI